MIIKSTEGEKERKFLVACDNCLDTTPPMREGEKLPDQWMHYVITALEEDPTDDTVGHYSTEVAYCSQKCAKDHERKLVFRFRMPDFRKDLS